MKTIDWNSDSWFAETHAGELTEEFKRWWLAFYGVPADYAEDEPGEYWVRCAFAWAGWRARGQEPFAVVCSG